MFVRIGSEIDFGWIEISIRLNANLETWCSPGAGFTWLINFVSWRSVGSWVVSSFVGSAETIEDSNLETLSLIMRPHPRSGLKM